MTRHALVMAVLSTVVIVAAGCAPAATPMRKIDTYTLFYPPPAPVASAPLAAVLRVNRFSVAPAYRSPKMVYRKAPVKTDTYHYHQWLASPGDLATYFLRRDLAATGRFAGVLAPESHTASTHRIEGVVEEFLEDDQEDRWQAVLTLSISLIRENEPDVARRILIQKTYAITEPADHRHPRAVAEAMSRAMKRVNEEIAGDIASRLGPP